jgi:hypothetical protein
MRFEQEILSKRRYDSEDKVKMAAFAAIQILKQVRDKGTLRGRS